MNKIKIDDFKNYKSLSSLEVNDDGSCVVFCVTEPNMSDNNYLSDIWRYDAAGNSVERLTNSGKVKSASFISGDAVIYAEISEPSDVERVKSGEYLTVFYKQGVLNGYDERKRLFELPLHNARAKQVDRDLLLISSVRDNYRPDFEGMSGDDKRKGLMEYKEEQDYEVCDELPFFIDSRGYVNKKRNSLYLYRISTDELKNITDSLFETSHSAISEDGKRIAFSGSCYKQIYDRSHGIYVYDIEKDETACILERGKYQIMGLDFYEDSLIAAAHPWDGYSPFPNHNLYVINIRTGEMKLAYSHDDEDFGAKISSDVRINGGTTFKVSGDKLYYLTTYEQTSYINVWNGRNKERLSKSNISADCFAANKKTVFLTGLLENNLQELYRLDEITGEVKKLSNFNDTNIDAVTPVPHSFINSDGIRIDGFVIKPRDCNENKRYPGVLEIHGGPRTSYSYVYSHEMQLLASEGYFVFYCNPRGSSGRGERFADINGRRGTVDYTDVMEFTDYILSLYPQIDSERLAVMGGSYGGYLTNWIIGHTNRFKAAVTMRSIVDVNGSFGATDFSIWSTIGAYGGNPWSNRENVWEQSPFKYALNIKTPTLILHSFEDHRCSIHGAMQLFSTLQSRRVPSRMCLFKNEGHELSRSGAPKHKIRRLKEILMWLEKYLKTIS
ncbi:S9 family peptidase [Sedimentibacter hydroxybenzoicus DSM 7310]|uniref:S9 family peptidase n=1 Tax=Sedimentibacter hydroxybenzoicus DSM 7310 TaxID=1123245 RepID=A0A974GX72_SEDHY|nr:S9 family peptidase [Sedimentibacter hydroxybenzoicus]NYB75277.1 S9 family peptidase [Sedimentibacter hydroxybenzoicus DSM 7310]